MSSTFLIGLLITFMCFIVPAVMYNSAVRRNAPILKQISFIPICLTVAVASLLSYFLFYNQHQFLASMSLVELILPFVVAILIYVIARAKNLYKLTYVAFACGAFICSFAIPQDAVAAISPLAPIYNRILVAVAWTFFSWIFAYSDTCEAMSGIQAFAITAGIAILGFINAVPPLLGMFSAYLAASCFALIIFNWYPSRISLNKIDVMCLGFLVFAPISWAVCENAASCTIIFSMYLLIDFVCAALLLLTFSRKYRNLIDNTSCRQALQKGLPPSMAASFSCRIQILLIFFGAFQTMSSHQYSLVLVTALMTLWFLYRFRNLDQKERSIAEINRQVIEDLQDRVNDIKQYIHGDDE